MKAESDKAYITDVVVLPEFQRRGIGTAIVAALTQWIEAFPFPNTVVAVFPTKGLMAFYVRHGYKAHSMDSPQMSKLIKPLMAYCAKIL